MRAVSLKSETIADNSRTLLFLFEVLSFILLCINNVLKKAALIPKDFEI